MSYYTKEFDGQVVKILQKGGIGFMPSDTVYGLSGRALDQGAVERIYQVKQREADKPFVILISSIKMLDPIGIRVSGSYGASLLSDNKLALELGEKYWPGPLTIICNAPAALAWLHRGAKTLAIRIPGQSELLKLLNQVGPLVSTSANKAAQPPVVFAEEAQKIFGDTLDFYVDKGHLAISQPSTIVRMDMGKLKVIRQGVINL